MSDAKLPARAQEGQVGNLASAIGGLPPSMQLLLDESLYNRIKQLSGVMANAKGMTPEHLIGKPEACFTIITNALDWKLNYNFCSRHTYQTPSGQIGYDGALVQAILERSGKFIGSPMFEFRGDWAQIVGKMERKTGRNGGEYYAPTWTDADATGLGVIVRWQVKGEDAPRVWPGENEPFWIVQCHPRNSPLWGTDPKSQICYLAIRRFANLTSPGILGAALFDVDELLDASERAIDITPKAPRREDFVEAQAEAVEEFVIVDMFGEIVDRTPNAERAVHQLRSALQAAARHGIVVLDETWEANEDEAKRLTPQLISEIRAEFAELRQQVITTAQRDSASVPPKKADADDPEPSPVLHNAAEDEVRGSPPTMARDASRVISEAPGSTISPEPTDVVAASLADGPGQNAMNAASPSSKAIPVPTRRGSSHGLDYRGWAKGLFGPKLRQMTTTADLAHFLGDNEETLRACRTALSAEDLTALDQDIDAQWKKVG